MRAQSTERSTKQRHDEGQAMVEFVVMLVVFMTLIAGQVYVARLLLFDHWAQQEARFIAYEQTEWPLAAQRDPFNELEDGSPFHRPSIVSRLDSDRETENEESVRDLLLSYRRPDFSSPKAPTETRPVMYAGRRGQSFSLVPEAFARQTTREAEETQDVQVFPIKNLPLFQDRRIAHTNLDDRIQVLIEKAGIGETVCRVGSRTFGAKGYRGAAAMFAASGCAQAMDRGLAVHLTNELDIRELTRDFSDRLEWGDHPRHALQQSVGDAVARGYYSFFDQMVRLSAMDAQTRILTIAHAADVNVSMLADDQFRDLLFSLRYVGSTVAELAVEGALAGVGAMAFANNDPDEEQDFAETMNSILHEDAKDTLGGVGYMLGLEYLPFTSIMLEPMYGGILNGVMENVLSKDNDLEDPLMHESNKEVVVTYDSGNGLFPAAVRRFRTSNRRLTSRHYLVTQSWNIPRRESPDGSYREIGDEDDDYSGSSDEAVLKRRVVGLWLMPANPVALLTPIVDLVDSSGSVGGLFNDNVVLEGFSEGVELLSATAKDFICDNPLNDFMGWLEYLPGFNSADVTLPACPAVRPAAYPFTKEITNDRLAGSPREFGDFVTEQKENNPRNRPQYHEDADTATNKGGQDDQGAKACEWTD